MSNVPFAAQMEQLAAYMASKISVPTIGIGGGYAPIGTIISYMGTTAPQDYLACDGSTKNIADYPQLAEFFAAQFGSANFFGGNGTTTFAVPDLQGEFLRGAGTNGHTNQGSGANVGVHQDSTTIPKVLGFENRVYSTNQVATNYDTEISVGQYSESSVGVGGSASDWNVFTLRPTNTSILYCIKAVVAGEVYSTEERVVGTWIDGKKIYQKTIDNLSLTLVWNSEYRCEVITNALVTNVKDIFYINALMENVDGTHRGYGDLTVFLGNDGWHLYALDSLRIKTITLRYTKTTDA